MGNLNNDDVSSLHTGPNCDFSEHESSQMTGSWLVHSNCTAPPDDGCGIIANNVNSFGIQFNKNGGGVFAAELNDAIGIRIWFWTHSNVPLDIAQKKPDPSQWGIPYAFWPFGAWCTSNHFQNLSILFDLYFCGWSGDDATWSEQCSTISNGQNCQEFVMNNPSYFRDAYW